MVGEKRLHRCRAYYWRKCKRVRGTNIDSLPDELLLEILARLSDDPDYLYNKARLVCRRWRHLVQSRDFIKTQLQRSTYGLLISLVDYATIVTATQGRIETSRVPFDEILPSSWCSCNGLALRHRYGQPPHIINRVIRRQLILPSFSCEHYAKMIPRGCGIGYAADSMEYKVVLPYWTVRDQVFLAILSVGIDKSWRHVGVEHLSVRARSLFQEGVLMTCNTEGFIIWSNYQHDSYLTLDVETEILTLHPSPLPKASPVGTSSFYLSTGRSLSLLVVHLRHTKYPVELWEMKEETGEWSKLICGIKLGEFSDGGSGFLMPLGWVRFPEVLALYCSRRGHCIFLNLNTQEISSMELRTQFGPHFAHAHKKSLTWFN